MKRLLLIIGCVGASACGPGTGNVWDEGQATATSGLTQRVRLMAGNLTSGNYQSYDPGHGSRIFQGVKPDIVMIQEFNDSSIPDFVQQTFGPEFGYVRGNGTIPNGVISRYPIRSGGEWVDSLSNGTRGFTWALIDVPGDNDIFAVSVHLLTSSSSKRSAEATDLVGKITAAAPSSAYIVIGGDFNTSSRTETAISTFRNVVVAAEPYPADRNGNSNTNSSRSKPYDWLLVSSGLHDRETSTDIGASHFAHGLVADTRVYQPISEISPALASDSGASSMQHMGVVRDFFLEDSAPPPPPPPPPGEAKVMMNELLANEPGSDTSKEFIELVNAGTADADLSGWTISDASAVRHTFAAGTVLPMGRALVVTGADASTHTLSLNNGGDTVTLASADGTVVDQVKYTSTLASVDGVSMNRSTDADSSAGFALHTSLSAASSSPGTRVDGSAF